MVNINMTETKPTPMPAIARFAEAGFPVLPAPLAALVAAVSGSGSWPESDDSRVGGSFWSGDALLLLRRAMVASSSG